MPALFAFRMCQREVASHWSSILLGWTEAEIGSAMIIVTGNRIRFSRRQPDPLFASAFLKLLPLVLAELVEFGEHGEV
jgi:hypothetical protein